MGAFPGWPLKELLLSTHGPRQTQALGALLGRLAEPGDVFLLVGNLGAGKTCLVQGLARGLGIQDSVSSPTFIFIREYRGRLPLYHVDCYRIESALEADQLGLEDYLEGPGLFVVEWADKVMDALPPEHLLVNIEYAGERERTFRVEAQGERYERLVEDLSRQYHMGEARS